MSVTDLGDPDQIIHIPLGDLTGTREAKLAELDMFLAQLHAVRLALRGQAVRLDGFIGGAGRHRRTPNGFWSWPSRGLRAVLTAFALGSPHRKSRRS